VQEVIDLPALIANPQVVAGVPDHVVELNQGGTGRMDDLARYAVTASRLASDCPCLGGGQARWAWKRPAATGATGPPTHSRPSGLGRTSIVLGRPVNRP
jgi:hypothetical protein